jgi:glucose/arabinose dehydrogenase
MRLIFLKTWAVAMLCSGTFTVAAADNHQELLGKLHLPSGFHISVFADGLPNARSMALGDNGVIFVGTGKEGKVYAVADSNGDGVAEPHHLIASGLNMPNGVAYKDGA